ncbi:hypothetical protein [Methanospirillum stamsii]|uniref:hypothetical protein n=1 Tax=Methanospirillum stamsii TaxID=1277351 RepID=UPI0015E8362F|nr:hypothetical protein [Methanospirillum stamsii]
MQPSACRRETQFIRGRFRSGRSTRKNSDRWMAGLTRKRVSSAGEGRPIIRNERKGRPNLLRSVRFFSTGIDD